MDVLLLVRNASALDAGAAKRRRRVGITHHSISPSVPADGRRSSARPLRHVREDNSKQKKNSGRARASGGWKPGTSARPTEVQVPGARPRERASMVGQKHT